MSGPPSSVDVDGSGSSSSSESLTYYEKKYGGGGTSSTSQGGPPPGIDVSSFRPSYTDADKGERGGQVVMLVRGVAVSTFPTRNN